MNLLEARATGKWYRRPCWDDQKFHMKGEGHSVTAGKSKFTPGTEYFTATAYETEDIDATDYVLEPDPAPVVRKVTVWRPMRKENGGYSFGHIWFASKHEAYAYYYTDRIDSWDKEIGWESKQIEVTA